MMREKIIADAILEFYLFECHLEGKQRKTKTVGHVLTVLQFAPR